LERLAGEIDSTLLVVLSDTNMPSVDGFDLPVMMVTAYGDDERRRRVSDLGASDFLAKPVDFERLKAQLQSCPTPPTKKIHPSIE
jgi:CheY-like chemotaxis protein